MTLQFAQVVSRGRSEGTSAPSQARCVFKCPDSGGGGGGPCCSEAVEFSCCRQRSRVDGDEKAEPSAGGDGRAIQHRSAATTGPEERKN